MLCLSHNVEAVSAVFLKGRSPIIDIEHTYLYSPTTMCHIFEAHGFQIEHIGSVYNKYSLNYLARLAPLPSVLKRFVLVLLKGNLVGRIRLSLPLGNLYLIARKPRQNQ